jgi:uncharacterized protein YndB with AHSA1/START domain
MSDLGQTQRVPAVRFERTFAVGLETVWACLTDPARLLAWYGEGATIEPAEGGAVYFAGGHIRGVVTQWRPHAKFAHTWNVFGPGETVSAYPESYLTFELEPAGGSVALVLTHLPVLERFEAQNQMGWHTFLDILAATLACEPVEERRVYMERNAARYGVDLNQLQS